MSKPKKSTLPETGLGAKYNPHAIVERWQQFSGEKARRKKQ